MSLHGNPFGPIRRPIRPYADTPANTLADTQADTPAPEPEPEPAPAPERCQRSDEAKRSEDRRSKSEKRRSEEAKKRKARSEAKRKAKIDLSPSDEAKSEMVVQLVAMLGFEGSVVAAALECAGWDVEAAANALAERDPEQKDFSLSKAESQADTPEPSCHFLRPFVTHVYRNALWARHTTAESD
jgi:hypothetical protein